MYRYVVTTIVLANISITSYNYHLFLVVRTFKVYSLSNFEYNTVLHDYSVMQHYNHDGVH